MKLQILSIKSKGDVVLNEHNKPVNPANSIWEAASSANGHAGLKHAVAFSLKREPAKLEVKILMDETLEGSRYKLEGLYDHKTVLFSGEAIADKSGKNELAVNVTALYAPIGFFQIKHKAIDWQLTSVSSGAKSSLESTRLELYWIYDYQHQFFRKGIPVETLSHMADICKCSDNDPDICFNQENKIIEKSGVSLTPAEIVTFYFQRNPPIYDNINGKPYYVDIAAGWDNITLHYTSYWNAKSTAICNCYDQAAIVQYGLRTIGLKPWYCFMKPFGYLKKTNLIGRGECNNPFYGGTGDAALIDNTNSRRTYFGNHAFCSTEDKKWIFDSCAGPHTGGEDPATYVKNAVDLNTPNPPKICPGTVADITAYKGVTKYDLTGSITNIAEMPHHEEFKKLMNYSEEDLNNSVKKMAVCSWPNPIICPELDKHNWKIVYEETLPGEIEVMKTWQLINGKESIEIKLYVSTGDTFPAIQRFLSIGSLSSLPELPYSKGPDYLGKYAAQSVHDNQSTYFWVSGNVVFDVTAHHVSFDIHILLKWLNEIINANVREITASDLPSVANIVCSNMQPHANEIISITKEVNDHVVVDFIIQGDGLMLVDETNDKLFFKAIKGENTLIVLAVDKNNLLTQKKEFMINVT